MHTDLPEPVAPAISPCGILPMSATIALPPMSLPKATVSLLFADENAGDSSIPRTPTTALALFGTSIPTAALFGIGASILTPAVARFKAISSARFVSLLIFTPAEGCNSYRVTVGHRLISTPLVSTPQLLRVSTSLSAVPSSSAESAAPFVFLVSLSKESGGNL